MFATAVRTARAIFRQMDHPPPHPDNLFAIAARTARAIFSQMEHPLPLSNNPRNGDRIAGMLDRLGFERLDIARPGIDAPYMSRWSVYGSSIHQTPRAVYVHRFRSDDLNAIHDHPWPFTSVILSGGYWEVTPEPSWHRDGKQTTRTWYGPLSVLRRPADWIHRIELPPGRECWTIVLRGRRERGWGFWCPKTIGPPRFVDWRQHSVSARERGEGCE